MKLKLTTDTWCVAGVSGRVTWVTWAWWTCQQAIFTNKFSQCSVRVITTSFSCCEPGSTVGVVGSCTIAFTNLMYIMQKWKRWIYVLRYITAKLKNKAYEIFMNYFHTLYVCCIAIVAAVGTQLPSVDVYICTVGIYRNSRWIRWVTNLTSRSNSSIF